jgi:hypothetical protein
MLVENNIIQANASPMICDAGTGNLVGYNFTPNVSYAGYLQGLYIGHNAGSEFELVEGNQTTSGLADDVWGTSHLSTMFRNQMYGWQPGYVNATNPVSLNSGVRAFNIVGNVLGEPGYHTQYESYATSTTAGMFTLTAGGTPSAGAGTVNQSIYEIGWSDTGGIGTCTTPPVCDPLSHSTLMRWGNYDVVQNAVTWNSTESSPGAVPYVNAQTTPSNHTLPASFYLSAKPSWFGSLAFPPVGPDVTGGNSGTFPSGTYSGVLCQNGSAAGGATCSSQWAGHVNLIPAASCYLNVMHGPPDGSGSVLSFDAATCYP